MPRTRPCFADLRMSGIAVDVTGATAVAELVGGVVLVLQCLRVCRRLEIRCVTSATGACIGRCNIRNVFSVGLVAPAAGQLLVMLTRIRRRSVLEADGRPVRVLVARGAVALRDNVVWRLADRAHMVVAGSATAGDRRVIQLCRMPCQSSVAGIAGLRRRDVRARHPNRTYGVVARGAGDRASARMIKTCRRPCVGGMACLALS